MANSRAERHAVDNVGLYSSLQQRTLVIFNLRFASRSYWNPAITGPKSHSLSKGDALLLVRQHSNRRRFALSLQDPTGVISLQDPTGVIANEGRKSSAYVVLDRFGTQRAPIHWSGRWMAKTLSWDTIRASCITRRFVKHFRRSPVVAARHGKSKPS